MEHLRAIRCELAAICFNKDELGNEMFEVGIPQVEAAPALPSFPGRIRSTAENFQSDTSEIGSKEKP
jgi:hypothetical protein